MTTPTSDKLNLFGILTLFFSLTLSMLCTKSGLKALKMRSLGFFLTFAWGTGVWSFISESCEKLEAEKAPSRNSAVVVTTAFGEEIEDEIVEIYFENKRKSGGGTIESFVKKDQQVIITFQDEQGMIVCYGCYTA